MAKVIDKKNWKVKRVNKKVVNFNWPKTGFKAFKKLDILDQDGINDFSLICELWIPAKAKKIAGEIEKKLALYYRNNLRRGVELVNHDLVTDTEMVGKCRASEAKILRIYGAETGMEYTKGLSQYNNNFVYEVGKTIKPNSFNTERMRHSECTNGIHFFLTEEEAREY